MSSATKPNDASLIRHLAHLTAGDCRRILLPLENREGLELRANCDDPLLWLRVRLLM